MPISKELEHILNNKMTVIMGFVDLAIIEKDDNKRNSLLSSSKKAIRDITRIISLNRELELSPDD